MPVSTKYLLTLVLSGALAYVGCASPADQTDSTSESEDVRLETGGMEAQDTGSSYNGWSHSVTGNWGWSAPPPISHIYMINLSSTFTRSFGDWTRGGGTCITLKKNSGGCSSDTTCTTAAQAQFGSDAWGYCQAGVCYARPGSQSSFCTIGPNRSPGTQYQPNVTTTVPNGYSAAYVLGCMTKTAGPNYACGGSNPSLYMRYIWWASFIQ